MEKTKGPKLNFSASGLLPFGLCCCLRLAGAVHMTVVPRWGHFREVFHHPDHTRMIQIHWIDQP
jgi:hypothetical protein